MSALRKTKTGAGVFEIPRSEIALGSLPEFEYGVLRAAINYAILFCSSAANEFTQGRDPKQIAERNLWLDRASEFRALQRRFLKRGRRGISG
jgi:hypothetical protein